MADSLEIEHEQAVTSTHDGEYLFHFTVHL